MNGSGGRVRESRAWWGREYKASGGTRGLHQCSCLLLALQTMLRQALCGLCLVVALAWGFPQGGGSGGGNKEGAFFTNEAIRQAQNTHLIPQGATIQKVQEGIELAAYESIPGDQRINLFEILGDHVPPEVVNNLQTQVDQVGKSRRR